MPDSQLYAVDETAPVVSSVIDPVTADKVANAAEAGGPVSVRARSVVSLVLVTR